MADVRGDERTPPLEAALSLGHQIVAVEAGDDVLEAFVADHYDRLIGLAGLVSGNVRSAEDIVQSALERAWRSRRSLRDGDRLRPWLDRIVVREAAREQRFRLLWASRLFRAPSVAEIPMPEVSVVDHISSRFPERSAMRSAFDDLGPAHRAVIVLHLHAGYTVDETATLLGLPRETVRSRLRVGRQRLRLALEGGTDRG